MTVTEFPEWAAILRFFYCSAFSAPFFDLFKGDGREISASLLVAYIPLTSKIPLAVVIGF
jgi:hypothetical protein